jgi:antitoxin VapB
MPRPRSHLSEGAREVRLFRNNRSQAVRIPVDLELPGDRALIRKDGERLIIEPAPRPNLVDVLASLAPLAPDDAFPDVDATLGKLRNVDL